MNLVEELGYLFVVERRPQKDREKRSRGQERREPVGDCEVIEGKLEPGSLRLVEKGGDPRSVLEKRGRKMLLIFHFVNFHSRQPVLK